MLVSLRSSPVLKVSNASLGSPAVANRGKKPQRVLGWTAVPVLSAALGYCKKPRGQSHVKARADRDSVRNKSQTRRRPWILAISMLLPLLVGKPPSYAAERWDDLSQRYAPASPPVRTKSSEVEVALAKHLRERDVKIFCTWYSRECQELREMFGQEAAELAPFVQCADKDKNFLSDDCPRQTSALIWDKKENGDFPLWLISDKFYYAQDDVNLPEAARLTSFRDFPLSKIRTEADFVQTRYIWS